MTDTQLSPCLECKMLRAQLALERVKSESMGGSHMLVFACCLVTALLLGFVVGGCL